jgi:hypothetical protein
MTDFAPGGIEMVEVPWIPKGTFYLVPKHAHLMPRVFLEPDLWDDAPASWPAYAVDERDRALRHLAMLLDRFADATPGSSWRRWRTERAAERSARRMRYRFVAEERLALTVTPPSFAHITGGP